MPIYEFLCSSCGKTASAFFHSDAHHNINCSGCGYPMKKNYQAMIPAVKYEENDSVTTHLTGEPIRYNSLRGLKEIAKKHGCEVAS